MGRSKEEIVADLVWRYVEEVREADAVGQRVRLTRPELQALVETLDTASRIPAALDSPEVSDCRAAVRDRLHGRLAHPPAAEALPSCRTPRPSRRANLLTRLVPAWTLAGAGTALAALVLALGSVNVWHRPAQVVKVRRVIAETPDNIHDLDEPQAHQLIPRMVKNELPPAEERDVMWHMLLCPGCFAQYVGLKHSDRNVRELRQDFIQLVRR